MLFRSFVAVLLEHCGGRLPLWLVPEQVIILPISEKYHDYAHTVAATLEKAGIRVSIDEKADTMGKKIRNAELAKTPYMLVVGEKEAEEGIVAARKHGEGDMGNFTTTEFIQYIEKAIEEMIGQ